MSATMTRQDVHRPSALVTEDYEFAFCDVHNPPPGEIPNGPYRVERMNALIAEGYRFECVHPSGQCDHCGTRINYYAILKHVPSKRLIEVGETCLANRFDRASEEFHELREASARLRAQHRVKKAREAFAAEHAELIAWLEAKMDGLADREFGEGNFFVSLSRALGRYGSLTEGQVGALEKAKARGEEVAVKREEEAETSAPVVEGRIEIAGVVLGLKTVPGYMGGDVLKMVVRDERGFKVYGTVPSTIDWPEGMSNLRERHVTLTATVEASTDDECFGFFKRPAKMKVIS